MAWWLMALDVQRAGLVHHAEDDQKARQGQHKNQMTRGATSPWQILKTCQRA
jgi:hypothetical protein